MLMMKDEPCNCNCMQGEIGQKRILEDSLQEISSKENSLQSQERSSEEDSSQERSSEEGCSQERYSEV